MTMITQDEIRAIMALGGFKQGQFADKLGVTQPTVSRWLKKENPSRPDSAQEDALRALQKSLLEGEHILPASNNSSYINTSKNPPFRIKERPNINFFSSQQNETVGKSTSVNYVYIDGFVQAGAFLQAEVFDDMPLEHITAPLDPDFPNAQQIAYRVIGDSMNMASPKPIFEGDVLICVKWQDVSTWIKDLNGLNVVVEQTLNDGQLRERSVKEIRDCGNFFELNPRSTNEKHYKIIVPKSHDSDDGREVKIIALVRYVLDFYPLPLPAGALIHQP